MDSSSGVVPKILFKLSNPQYQRIFFLQNIIRFQCGSPVELNPWKEIKNIPSDCVWEQAWLTPVILSPSVVTGDFQPKHKEGVSCVIQEIVFFNAIPATGINVQTEWIIFKAVLNDGIIFTSDDVQAVFPAVADLVSFDSMVSAGSPQIDAAFTISNSIP